MGRDFPVSVVWTPIEAAPAPDGNRLIHRSWAHTDSP